MNPVLTALSEIAKFLDQHGHTDAVIGGLAAGYRGQPRTTSDIDILLWVELGEENDAIQSVFEAFPARFEDADEVARTGRVIAINAHNDVPIDLALACFAFEEEKLKRATRAAIHRRLKVPILAAEDLVVSKWLADRAIDWFDIEGLFDRLGPRLDYEAIRTRILAIRDMLDAPAILQRLETIHQKSSEL